MLFEPSAHEVLTATGWNEERARASIRAIVADVERSFDAQELWPAHPLDLADGPLSRVKSLYLGAAGVIWALHELERLDAAHLRERWAAVATSLVERYVDEPDFQDVVTGVVPAFWTGEAGILLAAHTLAPNRELEDRLLEAVRANAANPSWELMWGSPGTMIAAQVMRERTGDERWRAAWVDSGELLWAEWRDDLWLQELYGNSTYILGPAHGFAGNVLALAQGGLLDDARRLELETRAVAVLAKYAQREEGTAQWPVSCEPRTGRSQGIRTQWCHGAPGIVASLSSLAPDNDALTELLVAGGELAWMAGPLSKGANLCHGTAGNGYAFLKLFARTGNERWLERARAFAMHAAEQVEAAGATHGMGRYSLWTGDPGTALFLQSCIDGTSALPTLDVF